MKNRMVKSVLAVLFSVCVCMAPGVSTAEQHGAAATGHGEAAATHATATSDAGHGAAATHGEAAAEVHGDAAAAHGGEGAHGGGHSRSSVTPKKLKDLVFRVLNFAVLVFLLMKFLAKPIGNALAGRRQRVREELEELQFKRDEAERAYREFETRLAGMEKEMEVVVEKAIAQAANEKAKILEEAEKAAEDLKRQAEASIQAELVEAKKALLEEAAERAAAMAEELIVKNLTADDQVKITEQYLDRVGAIQ